MAIYPRKILCELASYILEDIHTPGKNNEQIDEKKKQMKDLAIAEYVQQPVTENTKTMNPGQNRRNRSRSL